ncbi:MAG: hypothetical protein IT501_08310, partial [Rubrivivax sp.]|nr:hypothetical protein [Rubrivivax sp.]
MGRSARRRRAQRDRQRLGLRDVDGRVLQCVDLLRQRRARGQHGGVVPAHLPRPDAGDGAGLGAAAQDDPHCAHLAHHLDRRLHLQPLRQEPRAGRAGDADRAHRCRALCRPAAQGGGQRLRLADRCGRGRRGAALVARHHALRGAGAGGLHHRLRHAPPGHHAALRGHGGGDRRRVGGQAAGLRGRGRVRDLEPVRRAGGAGRAHRPDAGAGACAGRRWPALRLRPVVCAHAAGDAVGDPAAAPVPGDGGRERRRGARAPR